MGKKITGVVLAVTGAILAVGTAGAVPVTDGSGQVPSGKKVQTADATTQPKVKQGAAATNVRMAATPGGAVSGSTATEVKVKKDATPSTPTKSELGSQVTVNPAVKQGSTPGGKVSAAQTGKTTSPRVKSGAASGEAVAEYLIKR
jgi:hypothetical protein